MLVQSALQRWLGDLIAVQAVRVEADDATLNVTVQYSIRQTDQLQIETFQRTLGGRHDLRLLRQEAARSGRGAARRSTASITSKSSTASCRSSIRCASARCSCIA